MRPTLVIILAAGRGSRLEGHTQSKHKTLVSFQGESLMSMNLRNLEANGVPARDILLVLGYEPNQFDEIPRKYARVINENWASSSQVESICVGMEALDSRSALVLYGDVYHSPEALVAYFKHSHLPSIGSYTNWRKSWAARYDNPLEDLENFKVKRIEAGLILREIGGHPSSLEEVEGQFSGAVMVCSNLRAFFNSHRNCRCASSTTSLLQHYVECGGTLNVAEVGDPWFELDTPQDLVFARAVLAKVRP